MNDIFAIIGIFAVGFAAGMYVSTQISSWIDRNIK
jgi:hypothetical protein